MIGKSIPEYLFIQACIVSLTLWPILCVLYCAFVAANYRFHFAPTHYRLPVAFEALAAAETIFFLLFYPYRAYLKREAAHPPPPSKEERQELFRRCNLNITHIDDYLQKWFLGAKLEEIKKENVKEFFLWAFFNRGGEPGDDNEELEEYISATEKLLGRKIEDGRGTAECLRLTIDDPKMLHRSLIWYACVGFVDFLTFTTLRRHGFRFYRTSISSFFTLFPIRPQTLVTTYRSPCKYTTYWHRPHTSKTKLPVVFIHGIGIGLYPYTKFLNELNSKSGVESSDSNDQVGIIAVEIMPISFRITHSALERTLMCAEIDQILQAHFGSEQKFVLVSHSYGSVITTHLLKTPSIAARIGPIVLIDPVSICLHLPTVAFNFTRRPPSAANELQLYYFASMDPSVSHTLSRHFFWNENVLWKEDMQGRQVTVSLAGSDLIVDTEAVGQYLTKDQIKDDMNGNLIDLRDDCTGDQVDAGSDAGGIGTDQAWKSRPWKGSGIEVIWFDGLDHAQLFDTPKTRKRIIEVIRAYCGA